MRGHLDLDPHLHPDGVHGTMRLISDAFEIEYQVVIPAELAAQLCHDLSHILNRTHHTR